ncbi:MAG: SusC/RagA family TonB-linked outer membrane protein [Gemmatimonadota bacterium]
MLIIRKYVFALVMTALLPGLVVAQERGTVTGQVVEGATQQPLSGAQVTIVGTTLGTLTNQQGRFVIPNVPSGPRVVRATLIGYSQGEQSVAVPAGGSVAATFQLNETALQIEGVVVTATGELQRVRERGNVVSQIDVSGLDLAPITRMSDVLQGRSAGVVVQQPSGTTGSGSRIRIRGGASASLSNEPLLIIDGVRIEQSPNSSSLDLGGQMPSRLEDLNPSEIESIEILKGPAAAALYGTAAATGVIQITTRRGRAGPAQWNVFSEQGLVHERNPWRGNYLQLGEHASGAIIPCWTFRQATGLCEPTELLSWNPLMDREEGNGVSDTDLGPASPFRDGSRQVYGGSVSGGSDAMTYFIHGETETEEGIYANNNLDRVSLRANLRSQLRDDLDVTLTSGWTTSDLQMPFGDNSGVAGWIGDAITGAPEDDPEFRGYATEHPSAYEALSNNQGIGRLIGSLSSTYRPLTWLSVNGTAGLDVVNRHDRQTIPPNTLSSGSFPEGLRQSNRIEISNYTANLGATATHPVTESILSTTAIGGQFHQELFRGTFASGWRLLPGTNSLAGANARFAVNETNQDIRTVGAYGQQQIGYNDRIFLTGALRGDDNSAFGADFGFVWYPSLSASWVINEEPWFPELGPLNSLRLRAAIGRSGLRPGFRQAETFFTPIAATVEARDVPGFSVGGVGDPTLKPELSTETEVGFDLGLLDQRVGLEFTYYHKTSEDALVARRLAPSLGLATSRFENIGTVQNKGIELLVNAEVLNLDNLRWDATVSYSTNDNVLLEGTEPIQFGLVSSQRHTEGFPLGGFWYYPFTWSDPDGDGLVAAGDVHVSYDPDDIEYAGQPLPTRMASLSTALTVFDFIQVSGLLEHQGGHTQWSGTDEWQCVYLNCRDINDPNTPPELQARAIADALFGTWFGYFEDADFVKLREVAVTLMAPTDWVNRFRFDGVSLTLSGRNLKTWTDYTGLDPEANFAGANNWTTTEFQTQPPVRYWTARLNVNF